MNYYDVIVRVGKIERMHDSSTLKPLRIEVWNHRGNLTLTMSRNAAADLSQKLAQYLKTTSGAI
jgi:hypothetical protein